MEVIRIAIIFQTWDILDQLHFFNSLPSAVEHLYDCVEYFHDCLEYFHDGVQNLHDGAQRLHDGVQHLHAGKYDPACSANYLLRLLTEDLEDVKVAFVIKALKNPPDS